MVVAKLREIKVVEVADFVGLATHSRDLGDYPQLSKLDQASPEVALRTKMTARRIRIERREALQQIKPSVDLPNNPTVIYTSK